MNGESGFDYIEGKLDLEKLIEVLLTHLNNPFERQDILKTTRMILKESKGLVESMSAGQDNLTDSLISYHRQKEEEYLKSARLKRLFTLFRSENDVEREAFEQAKEDTHQLKEALSLSQDTTIKRLVEAHPQLVTNLQELLLHLSEEAEEGKEFSKDLLEKLFNQILSEDVD